MVPLRMETHPSPPPLPPPARPAASLLKQFMHRFEGGETTMTDMGLPPTITDASMADALVGLAMFVAMVLMIDEAAACCITRMLTSSTTLPTRTSMSTSAGNTPLPAAVATADRIEASTEEL